MEIQHHNQHHNDHIPLVNHERKSPAIGLVFGIITALGASSIASGITWFFTSKTQIQLIEQKIEFQNLTVKELKDDVKELKTELKKNKEISVQNQYINDSTIQQLNQEIRLLHTKLTLLEKYIKEKR